MIDKEIIYEELLNEISLLKQKGILIIVEGKNDKRALQKLGLKNILTLEGKALYETAESVKDKEIALLTDLDKEGKKLYARLKGMFSKEGVKVDNSLRKILLKTGLKQIEGLHSYIATIKQK